MLTFAHLPVEILTNIISFTDVQGIIGLSRVDKHTNLKIQEIASQYLSEVECFYSSLTNLQQHYCYRHVELIDLAKDYKGKVMTSDLVKIVDKGTITHCLVLNPKMTDKDIDLWVNIIEGMDMYPHFHQTPRCHHNFIRSILELIKCNKPYDVLVTACLGEAYRNEIKDESKPFPYKEIYHTVFPIQKISLQINSVSTISEESKKKIRQSVEWANKFYFEVSKPENRNKLEKSINFDTMRVIMG